MSPQTAEPQGHAHDPVPKVHTPLPTPPDTPAVLHLSFFEDNGYFAVGMDRGFLIFSCDPFREIVRRVVDVGGISTVDVAFRYNIMSLVGGGANPKFPSNKVMMWDNSRGQCVGELSFRSKVRSVRLGYDRVIVLLEHKVFVYNLVDLQLLHQMETISNPSGLCAVSQLAGSLIVVCPGLQKGHVRVEHYAPKRTKFIMAHESKIASLALNTDGRFLATASVKGTLVRIFSSEDGTPLREVRRGADRADVYSLAFSSTGQWLAVLSDKGTVHVFNLKVNTESPGNDNSKFESDSTLAVTQSSSFRSFIKGLLPKYFSSEWSAAQFRLPEGCRYTVAFGHQKNTLIILGMNGSFYRCQFDPVNGGEMAQLEYHNFLKPEKNL